MGDILALSSLGEEWRFSLEVSIRFNGLSRSFFFELSRLRKIVKHGRADWQDNAITCPKQFYSMCSVRAALAKNFAMPRWNIIRLCLEIVFSGMINHVINENIWKHEFSGIWYPYVVKSSIIMVKQIGIWSFEKSPFFLPSAWTELLENSEKMTALRFTFQARKFACKTCRCSGSFLIPVSLKLFRN